jgi:hypothetical protein
MDKIFAETFPSGSIKTSVTSVTVVNNTTKTVDISVPTDTVWAIQSIKVVNPDDVARTVGINLYNEVAKTNQIALLTAASVGAGGLIHYPSNAAVENSELTRTGYPLVLGPGMTINIVLAAGGASSGGTTADGIVILYRQLSLT